ncbi:AAA family ATPase [Actinocrispum wychmicini]|uniref:Cytidylate kinase n=1 Tax=Actinocrispum wychmicini TaxID=1213861 RepID=A0A4R2JJR4_9PSEU|nr:cytidylate kinase family protein [Actinocrispum wychmicini]TCO56759.1 cytidylate kinase [Actinocrispum wychmicini]
MDSSGVEFKTNIAFAGLTAAGKTTHSRLLAEDLGYDYVSATDILLEILGIADSGDQIWFTHLDEIHSARDDEAVDTELENRLLEMVRTRQRTVFDTWALAWIGPAPLVRIWIESDIASRARKCVVSERANRFNEEQCRQLIHNKDIYNREIFQRRHGFDLFRDRSRYDAILCNSHLIPEATEEAAATGIESFAPVVLSVATSLLGRDRVGLQATCRRYPGEVLGVAA